MPLAATAQAQSPQPPDPQELARRGDQTAHRFASESASWTSVIELPKSPATIEIATTMHKGARDSKISIVQGPTKQELVRILERDGYWCVQADNRVGKYRPYEAPLPLPSTYVFLQKSQPQIVASADTIGASKLESLQKNIARYRSPLPQSARLQLQQALSSFEQLQQQSSASERPEIAKMAAQMRDALENGSLCEVDTDSGFLLSNGLTGNRVWLKDFSWLPQSDPEPIPAEFAAAEDFTRPLTDSAASLNDLAMIAYAAAWQPGGPKIDTNVVIPNTLTGEIRRVPYPGATLTGCFSKDRLSVFITGHVVEAGNLGLFQVNLAKGTVRPVAQKELTGMTMFPTLSPDGRFLAVLNRDGRSGGLLESQVCVVEVATGAVQKIGSPMDTAFLSWLPDQTGLILVTREKGDRNKPQKNTIAKLALDGHITPLRRGAFPIVIPERQRILFLNEDDNLWRTCDMTGQNEALVGDGLREFGFPALSPDGKRLLMMHFAKSTGPSPYFVDLDTGHAAPIVVGNGLWAMPAWR